MNRRFFGRVDVKANGELLWATKSRLGKVKTHREYVTTINVSVDGAKIEMRGNHQFPKNARAQLKLGIEYCDVEVLEVSRGPRGSILRLALVSPTARFVAVVEQWLPVSADERSEFSSSWT